MKTSKGWPIVKLGTIADIKGGKRLPKGADFAETGYPYIRARDIRKGRVTFNDPVYIDDHIRSKIKRYTVEQGDVCITIVGINVGDVGIIPRSLHTANLTENAAKVTNLIGCEPAYLNHYLQYSGIKEQMQLFSSGAAQDKLGLYKIKLLDVYLPELAIQRKIAAILTAYDDLIEANERRIALLEKMAEELYREWFVRMRFPGYQDTKFVKGVPEGWPLERFTELVEMNPRESINKSDPVPYVGMENLSQTSMHFVSNEKRTGASGSKFRNRDSLLPRITPCLENGKRGFVTCLDDQQVGLGSTEFIVFREKVLPAEYIYLLTCNTSFRQHAELSMTGASGRQRVQHDCFGYFLIPTPPEEIRKQFVEVARPLFESISHFAAQIGVLTQTRDLLLPRLISGKLSVADLDIQFPPSMLEETTEPEHAHA